MHRRQLNRGTGFTATDRMTLVNQHTCGRKHGQRVRVALRATVRRASTVMLRFGDTATAGELLASRVTTTRATMASSISGLGRGFLFGLRVARRAHSDEVHEYRVRSRVTLPDRCDDPGETRRATRRSCRSGSRHRRCSNRRNGRRRRSSHVSGHGSSSEDDSDGTVVLVQHAVSRQHRIKPRTLDGSGSFETLNWAHFENCAAYNRWNEADKLAHLKASLVGDAGETLWDSDVAATNSVEKLTALLRSRYSNRRQADKYRMELRLRRRRPGESLSALH